MYRGNLDDLLVFLSVAQERSFTRAATEAERFYAGYRLYYPGRRQTTPAFTLLVGALRYRGRAPEWQLRGIKTSSRRPRLSGRSAFSQETFAGGCGRENGRRQRTSASRRRCDFRP